MRRGSPFTAKLEQQGSRVLGRYFSVLDIGRMICTWARYSPQPNAYGSILQRYGLSLPIRSPGIKPVTPSREERIIQSIFGYETTLDEPKLQYRWNAKVDREIRDAEKAKDWEAALRGEPRQDDFEI